MINLYLYKLVDIFFEIVYVSLMIRILLSWIPHDPSHKIISLLYRFTDPILEPFRNIIPVSKIGIDLSPLLAFLVLGFIKHLLLQLLS